MAMLELNDTDGLSNWKATSISVLLLIAVSFHNRGRSDE